MTENEDEIPELDVDAADADEALEQLVDADQPVHTNDADD